MSQIICTFAPNMKRVYAILLLLVAFSMSLWAQEQEMSVAERNAAQGFNDTIDRLDPDFVLVSLCIADPTTYKQDALGTSGHAFLRLQCPVFGLDLCFSYEGENVNDNLYKYISGQTKMGLFRAPTNAYLEDFRHWNRSVHEYRLNMPPEAEQRLWEIMDNHTTNKISLRHDLNKYGCAITVVRYVKQALEGIQIVYAPDPEMEQMTRREIGYRTLANHPWLRLTSMIFTDNKADAALPIDEKLIIPADLAEVWQHASVDGQPFAMYVGDIVDGAPLNDSKPWFTPMLAALFILIITIGFASTRYPYWDWLLLSGQAIYGCVLIFLWIVMREFGGAAYIVMVLFNPLPLVLWKWRSYWTLPYAILLAIGVIILTCWPHMLVDPAFLVLGLAYVVLFAKDSVKRVIASLR